MADLKVGDSFPSGVTFSYVPYTPETGDITSCGIPINYDASKGMSSLFLRASPIPGSQSATSVSCFAPTIPLSKSISLTQKLC